MAASTSRPPSASAEASRRRATSTGSRSRCRPNAAISWGERGHTKWDFAPVLQDKLADYIMPDVTWTGGITELKKIAALAEAYYIPVSPHDAAGPINLVAGAQVM